MLVLTMQERIASKEGNQQKEKEETNKDCSGAEHMDMFYSNRITLDMAAQKQKVVSKVRDQVAVYKRRIYASRASMDGENKRFCEIYWK